LIILIDVNLDDIAPIVIPENPMVKPKPAFNFELTQYKKV